MIKTVNINLGGIVYQIDEDAYESLRKYLNSLNQYYKYTEGREEIVSDIESRLAELFGESLSKSGFQVVSMGDVEEVIEIMGRPEDFDVDGDLHEETPNNGATASDRKITRRLYRDPDNAVIAGVSSGLSAYWGIKDNLWIRIAFIILTLFTGAFALVYIVLWVVLPKAITSSQKLEMQGSAININNLEKKIREEFDDATQNLNEYSNSNPNKSILRSIVNGIGKIFGAFARVAFFCIKIFIAALALVIFFALIVSLIASLFSLIMLIPLGIKYIFASGLVGLLALVGGILTLGVPLIFLIYLPFRVFSKRRIQYKNAGIIGVGLFFLGLICVGISTAEVSSYFSERETISNEEILDYPYSDTLYVSINHNEADYDRLDYNPRFSNIFAFTNRLETASDWIELDVEPSNGESIYLQSNYKSRGKNNKKATRNAEAINHSYTMSGNRLSINPYFGLGEKSKWRLQEVKLELLLPENLVVVFDEDVSQILDNADNSRSVNGYNVAGHSWIMKNGMLDALDSIPNKVSNFNRKNMESFPFKNFDKLLISGNADVEIVQGDSYEIYTSSNRKRSVEFEVEKNGDEISIYSEGDGNNFSIGFLKSRRYETPKFYIVMPNIELLEVKGQSDVYLTNFKQDQMEVRVSAQSDVDLEKIDIGELTTKMNGQSDITISGEVQEFYLTGSSQSNMNGEELTVDDLEIVLSGQSDAEMIVNDKIVARLSGQSDFEYWGNPEVQQTVTGQSDIYHRDK